MAVNLTRDSVRLHRLLAALCVLLPMLVGAAEAPASDLEQQLRMGGADRVNARLGQEPANMAALNQRTADCEPSSVALAVRLARTKVVNAARLHQESLRVAVGACTELVLSQLLASEVPRICASSAAWSITQTARELRRRIAQLDLDEAERPSEHGKACRAAYLHELHHTRVALRVARPGGGAR